MYAVVAPGLNGIYDDPKMIDRVLTLYPYAKFRKLKTEEECWAFLKRYENSHSIEDIRDFGDTFTHHVTMEYFIYDSNFYYNFDTSKLGTLRILSDKAIIENRTNLVKAMIPNVKVDARTISSHIIAIYNGIKLLGDFIDVEVIVPDHSILYAIRSYTGQNRSIARLSDYIRTRLGKVSVTLRR